MEKTEAWLRNLGTEFAETQNTGFFDEIPETEFNNTLIDESINLTQALGPSVSQIISEGDAVSQTQHIISEGSISSTQKTCKISEKSIDDEFEESQKISEKSIDNQIGSLKNTQRSKFEDTQKPVPKPFNPTERILPTIETTHFSLNRGEIYELAGNNLTNINDLLIDTFLEISCKVLLILTTFTESYRSSKFSLSVNSCINTIF